MSKKDTKKNSAPQEQKATPKKKFKFVIKKPDLSKFKNGGYKSLLKNLGLVLLIVASFALIDLLVQYLNNDYSVAVVNGVRISESKWHKSLESMYGEATADQLIEEEIIKQEAKKEEISVSKEEIDAKIDEIITSLGGEELYQKALEANNLTDSDLKSQIELDLLTQKLLEPSIKYTEDDVKAFFEQYSDIIFPDETKALEKGAKLNYDEYKDKTEEFYKQQQVQTKSATWLNEKKAEYKIQNNTTSKPAYGFLTTTTNIIKNLTNDVEKTQTEK